jgi:hypothetical protein
LRLGSHHEDVLRGVQAPAVDEQATKLLQRLAKKFPKPGTRFDVSIVDAELMAVAWASDQMHMNFLVLDYLCQARGFLVADNNFATGNAYRVRISPKGWEYLQAIQRANPDSDLGFIAMWFHDSTTALRDLGLKPAVRAAGYRPTVMDERPHANRIDAEIVATIRRSRLLVADIRGRRGGVYFEAGWAQGLGIPVFWTCNQRVLDRQRLHFDIRQYLFTPWTGEDWPRFVRVSSVMQSSSPVVIEKSPALSTRGGAPWQGTKHVKMRSSTFRLLTWRRASWSGKTAGRRSAVCIRTTTCRSPRSPGGWISIARPSVAA